MRGRVGLEGGRGEEVSVGRAEGAMVVLLWWWW
jgi:hypothetical protein